MRKILHPILIKRVNFAIALLKIIPFIFWEVFIPKSSKYWFSLIQSNLKLKIKEKSFNKKWPFEKVCSPLTSFLAPWFYPLEILAPGILPRILPAQNFDHLIFWQPDAVLPLNVHKRAKNLQALLISYVHQQISRSAIFKNSFLCISIEKV